MNGKELHERFLPTLADKIMDRYGTHIANIDKEERALLLRVKNTMKKREVEEQMKAFLTTEGARTMLTQCESEASLLRIADAAYFKISKMMKDRSVWPPPAGHELTTHKPLDHQHPDFSMQTKAGYVFLRGTLKHDEEMVVQLRKNIQIGGYILAGSEVKEHVLKQLEKQTYPFDVDIKLVENEEAIEKSMTFKEKRDMEKAARARA
ncbi:unnamed protein product [Prorocentrum cordatum]|uniref:Uncharacterized protein n=1 Tax=Prorocentrum cordatum TaxID=2364126 RepID=A0ABN9TJM2_9DINO|nr:unnamed protein product [Polarella glacialis]